MPEQASWLNIAEIELSILERQCVARRLSREQLDKEVPDWQNVRNRSQGKVNQQFTAADARTKLRRLYPDLNKTNESTG